MAWTAPRTWVTDEVTTPAMFNTHIRDNFAAIGDPWTAYTPTWTATTTNPTIGNGSIVGSYMLAGKFCTFRAVVSVGSTTTAGSGSYSLSLPFTVGGAGRLRFRGLWRDESASNDYPIFGLVAAGGTAALLRQFAGTAGGAAVAVTHNSPLTPANTDSISIAGTFEVA